MRLENFQEWIAIRPNHSDEAEPLSGRLSFDLEKGIYLETIRFLRHDIKQEGDLSRGRTMTGWLDYQRPATIIQPWVQRTDGFTISMDTPVLKDSRRFVANGLLKNFFLEDLGDAVFTGLVVEHPAFHAWVNPQLVGSSWSTPEDIGLPRLTVDVKSPQQRLFTLADGTLAEVNSAIRVPRGEATTLEEYTVLNLRFPMPVNYDAIVRLTWRISSLFEFLIGARVPAPAYQLPTTQKRKWNNEEREVIAELWYHPIPRKKIKDVLPNEHTLLTFERRCPVPLEYLLNHVVGGSDELIYLANLVQSVEDYDLPLTQGYGELLGCLEAFDDRTFGSGAEDNFRQNIEILSKLVENYGTDNDKTLFSRIKGNTPNKFSLLKRLERLHRQWNADGFRCNPNLSRIRDLRNIVPHGRGLDLSSAVAEEMVYFLSYLSALGRYHVLKQIGFDGNQIAAAFSWQAHRYGLFVPLNSHD